MDALKEYQGPDPRESHRFLSEIREWGVQIRVTGPSKKTIRLEYPGSISTKRLGFINAPVINTVGGIYGYHFAPLNLNADGCPATLRAEENPYIIEFLKRYDCSINEIDTRTQLKNGTDLTYITITTLDLALQIIDHEIHDGLTSERTHIARGELFREGRCYDVVMTQRERSAGARRRCLTVHGFSCAACGVNLKLKYQGLSSELIHVHHESPVSQRPGEYDIDPIAEMKPVCPNCHCVIHSKQPPYTIAEVRDMLSVA